MKKSILFCLGILSFMLISEGTEAGSQKKKKRKEEKKELSIYEVDTLISPIPNNRASFHMNIDKEQRRADASDGKVDGILYYSEDSLLTNVLTKSIYQDINHIKVMVENMPINTTDKFGDNQARIKYLRATQNLLRKFNSDTHVDPIFYKKQIANLRDMIIAHSQGKIMEFVKENANIYTLNNSEVFSDNPEARTYIYTEMGKKEPQLMIRRLNEFVNEPFADNIIASAAKVVPQEVYNYASSTNFTLSNAVKRSKDPLVQTIVRIKDESKAPLKAMPFLSDIYNQKKTIAEIDKITSNPDLFYKNLVRLKLENEQLGGNTYTDELQYRGLAYVRTMNDLHESPDAVRFKCIDGFSPEELYFLMVYGQDEIYTSSYVGTFKRMMERMKPMKGDELLGKVHYDHFRTFIRMCAGYNTLSSFLGTMDEEKKTVLMKSFISDLEKGKENELEDAVDVADAFGSIADSTLSTFLLKEVQYNYERCATARSKKGLIVYGLLATLFKGSQAGESSVSSVSNELNLPPINLVPYKNLVNDSGVVYEQFFFFGDEDGKNSYSSFLTNFKDGKWKVSTDKYWTTITSTSGKPVVIYANLPLTEPADEEAQEKLAQYLESKNIHPAIMVHRGHSYHLPSTMDRLSSETKIVMLGSCGGYHNLATVLDHSPDAHIISSKQVGAMAINEPIIKAINTQLLAGNDIDWVSMWSSLKLYFDGKSGERDRFNDYVPPHKNLGAIFIKAYRRISNSIE